MFQCEGCNEFLNDKAVNRAVVALFAREGADAWYRHSAEEILPAGTKCPKCGGTKFRKEMDIIDVWFESGSSQAAVLGREPGLPWPADLYLEGGDQHRGWFHSSLLCAVGTKGAAPFRRVATVGWTLDPQGRAQSKSLGNTVDPVAIADKMGAEIVRLWVASVDFREDVMASDELMQRIAESYRKLRNTFRYILGNLHDFDPGRDAVNFADMHELDQYILLRASELAKDVREHYDNFVFHKVYQRLKDFCIVDLSSIYFDVLKDRLYTSAPKSQARRSAQTALWRLGEALVRLLAPVTSFTSEEVWGFMPAGRRTSRKCARDRVPCSAGSDGRVAAGVRCGCAGSRLGCTLERPQRSSEDAGGGARREANRWKPRGPASPRRSREALSSAEETPRPVALLVYRFRCCAGEVAGQQRRRRAGRHGEQGAGPKV